MRFERYVLPSDYYHPDRVFTYLAELRQHWRAFGWEEMSRSDESAFRSGWETHLQHDGRARLPGPWRRWDVRSLGRLTGVSHPAEADFTLKVLAAFRTCVPSGEKLRAVNWQSTWYYLDPHAGINAATRDEWAWPILPDGDSYTFVSADYRLGVISHWFGKIIVFGRPLLAALERDPPLEFTRACRFAGGRRLSKRCNTPRVPSRAAPGTSLE